MKKTCKVLLNVCSSVCLLAFVSGCESLDTGNPNRPHGSPAAEHGSLTSETINIGDAVIVTFSDLPIVIPDFKERVKSDGSVTLLYSQKFQFAGKNRGDIEAEIRARYVPAYFNNLTVTIQLAERFFFVDGEVKRSDRYVVAGETTVLKAIASAGGLTPFAKRSKIRLTRANGQSYKVDYDAALANPALDLPVYAGDKITVPRRYF